MTSRRLCSLIASLSLCALGHADTLQTAVASQPIPTDLNLAALGATLTGLTALGMFLSFRRPLYTALKSGAAEQDPSATRGPELA